jgi:hypothetical protein
MKFVAVVFLTAGMLCNSMLAIAEGPIPFSALEQSANAQPSAALSHEATAGSTSARQTQPRSMTRGGKVMTGVGIGCLALGGALIGTRIALRGNSFDVPHVANAVGYGGGAVLAGTGTVLILYGTHRRSPK